MKGKNWQKPREALPLGCLSIRYHTALRFLCLRPRDQAPSHSSVIISRRRRRRVSAFRWGQRRNGRTINTFALGILRRIHVPHSRPRPPCALKTRGPKNDTTRTHSSIAALSTRPGDRDRRPVLPPTGRRRASKRARQSIARALGRAGGVRRIARPGTRVCQTGRQAGPALAGSAWVPGTAVCVGWGE